MGFEPMRVAPADLESAALDRSATCASFALLGPLVAFNTLRIIIKLKKWQNRTINSLSTGSRI